jgi:hypothetical protein
VIGSRMIDPCSQVFFKNGTDKVLPHLSSLYFLFVYRGKIVDKNHFIYHNETMKKTVYLDTTFPSYLFDNRDEIREFIHITQKWWRDESRKYVVVTSENTINELSKGNYPNNKEKILEFSLKLKMLPFSEDIVRISQIYIEHSLMPSDLEGDAMHLAYANKKNHIRFLNTKLGLFIPDIITPLELFEEDKDVY